MLKDKIAVVTGGSRGIGKAISIKLAKLGATVVINYNGSFDGATKVQEEIIAFGGKAEIIKANISNYNECETLINNVVEKYGKIDILVNNAGITRDGLLIKMNEADFDDVISTNLKGTFNCIKFSARHMIKQKGGKIVNLSSIAGTMGNPGQVNYSASKAGVIGITKSAAKELARKNINVNAVAPGFIETDMTDNLNEDAKANILNGVPLKRAGKPEDIANVVAFLVSEDAAYITGQVILVDGGLAM
ncbi:MAG: 3-oxoacyl-[acyl-carrier-protein] reductase [Anaerovoracaceae bacterium]